GVEDKPEADAVAEARLVEEQGRLGEQGVEPAAGLVLGLADVVGGEARLDLLHPLEGIMKLGEGHRAAVVPGVDHRADPLHLPAAALAAEGDLVDVGTVEVVWALSPVPDQVLFRADAGHRLAALPGAAPDRQRRAPVAVA